MISESLSRVLIQLFCNLLKMLQSSVTGIRIFWEVLGHKAVETLDTSLFS